MAFQLFKVLLLVVSTLFNAVPLAPVSHVKNAVCGSDYVILPPYLEYFCSTLDVLQLPSAPPLLTVDATPPAVAALPQDPPPDLPLDLGRWQSDPSHRAQVARHSTSYYYKPTVKDIYDPRPTSVPELEDEASRSSNEDPTSLDDDDLPLPVKVLISIISMILNCILFRCYLCQQFQEFNRYYRRLQRAHQHTIRAGAQVVPPAQTQQPAQPVQPARFWDSYVQAISRGLAWLFSRFRSSNGDSLGRADIVDNSSAQNPPERTDIVEPPTSNFDEVDEQPVHQPPPLEDLVIDELGGAENTMVLEFPSVVAAPKPRYTRSGSRCRRIRQQKARALEEAGQAAERPSTSQLPEVGEAEPAGIHRDRRAGKKVRQRQLAQERKVAARLARAEGGSLQAEDMDRDVEGLFESGDEGVLM